MRIIRFIDEFGGERLGHDRGDGTATLLDSDLFDSFQRTSKSAGIYELLAPLVPTDIICVGRNYHITTNHAGSESPRRRDPDRAAAQPDYTLEVFLKPSTALQHPNNPILIPRFEGLDANLDCEGELAVVIARDARNISEEHALECVFGYTIANDVTARGFQTAEGPPLWMRGKGFDTFCPLGPVLITRDEILDPQNLAIRTIINGTIVRDGHTSKMIRSVREIIATLSRHMTLRQGAVILTGAPPAIQSTPPLRTGDSVCVRIDTLGEMTNGIV